MKAEDSMKGIYYEGHYYQIPDGYASLKEFILLSDFSAPVKLTELIQKTCMAPYFTEKAAQDCFVWIEHPQYFIEIDYFLLNQDDYDGQLSALVQTKCPGCLRYEGDAKNLEGHYDEMSLDGTCFEKDENQDFFFHYGFLYFWRTFRIHQKRIESWIDKGRIAFAERKVTRLMFMMTSSKVYLRKYDQQYHFYVTDFGSPIGKLFIEYMIKIGNSTGIKGWVLHPYLDKEGFRRMYRRTGDPLRKSPPHIIPVTVDWTDEKEKALFILIHNYHDNARLIEASYLYFAEKLGEDRLYKILADLYFIDDQGFDIYNDQYHVNPQSLNSEDILDCEQIDDLISGYESSDERLRKTYPEYLYQTLGPKWNLNEVLPEFKGIESIHSKLPILDEERLFGAVKFMTLIDETHIIIGTVKIRIGIQDDASKMALAYLRNTLKKALVDSFYAMDFSEYYYPRSVEFNFIVMNSRLTRKAIRNLSPLLKRFDAGYKEYMAGEETFYHMDFAFLPFLEESAETNA
jgi:hypothetical protein